jgi:Transcription factor WhiB
MICADCPLQVPCLADALTRGEPDGVWGGYTTEQRHAIVARLRRRAADVTRREQTASL